MAKQNKNKRTTISQVISRTNIRTMLIAIVIYGFFVLLDSFFTSTQILINSLNGRTQEASQRISLILQSYKNVVTTLGTMPEFSNENISAEEKINILQNRTKSFDYVLTGILDKDGVGIADKISRADRTYFSEALKGNVSFTGPVISKGDGTSLVLVCAGPVWKDGIIGGTVDSVVFCSISTELLNRTMSSIQNSRNGNTYILDKEGKPVAFHDTENDQEFYSYIQKTELNPKNITLSRVAGIERNILSGEKYKTLIRIRGILNAFSGKKIENSPGWYLILSAPVTDSMINFFGTLFAMTIFGFALVFACHCAIKRSAARISEPVQKIADRLYRAAVGDFSSEVQINNSIEEISVISEATQKLTNRMAAVFGNSASNPDIADFSNVFILKEYEDVNHSFEEALHISLCLYDKNMKKQFGTENLESSNRITQNIFVNGRLTGKYIIAPCPGCLLHHEELEQLIQNMAFLLGKYFERTITREEKYQAWQQNEMINVNNILSRTENISQNMQKWIDNCRRELSQNNNLDWLKIAEEAEHQISLINESTEYARFTSLSTEIHENDYEVSELLTNISQKAKNNMSGKYSIKINYDPSIPARLFGDKDSIERAVLRSLFCLKNYNEESDITVDMNCTKAEMGLSFNIEITIETPSLSQPDINRLRLFVLKNDHSGDTLTIFEQKIMTAVKLVTNMNGSVKVTSEENAPSLKVTISIPQLEATVAGETVKGVAD